MWQGHLSKKPLLLSAHDQLVVNLQQESGSEWVGKMTSSPKIETACNVAPHPIFEGCIVSPFGNHLPPHLIATVSK